MQTLIFHFACVLEFKFITDYNDCEKRWRLCDKMLRSKENITKVKLSGAREKKVKRQSLLKSFWQIKTKNYQEVWTFFY